MAYPSDLPGKGESIETAIDEINNGGVALLKSWTSLAVTGRPIIASICEQINNSDITIADITNLNPNVLFELGYSISKRKRLWLLFNPKVCGAKVLFDQFGLLSTTGYAGYSNSHDIATKFYSDAPYSSPAKILYDEALGTARPVKEDALLYIKPTIPTEPVVRIARRVVDGPIPQVIDDPQEIGIQPLEWYLTNVSAAAGVVCHFLSEAYEGVRISNAKAAFVAGLAYGLGKPLLMLAHAPYISPIDYRDLLRIHHDAKQAVSFYDNWLSVVLEENQERSKRRAKHRNVTIAHGGLLELNLGDPIAEYESEELPEYFIPTAAYAEALSRQHSIFVGRRGTGKSATLLKLSDEISADPRNHVCVIKPIDYELEGLISLLRQQMSTSEKGYLVESLWKALIYTELAKSIYEKIKGRPDFATKTKAEEALVAFVEANSEIILPEFSARMEAFVDRLSRVTESGEVKSRISEAIHKVIISRLRDLILGALEKANTVAILVDNLDKNWNSRTNIQLVSELLFGLLSVSLRTAEEFRKSSLGKRRLDLALTVFLRSDIYSAVISFAREPDKLPIRKIEWTDPELLKRVIERRFMVADPNLLDPQEVWSKYFCEFTNSVPTKDFLTYAVFPRPRDLIYLVRASQQNAVNRGHTRIEEKDIETGVVKYSGFLLSSLMAEGSPQFRKLDDFVTQLFGGESILTIDDIRQALEDCEGKFTSAEFVIDLLIDLNFLSYETSPDKFVFVFDEDQKSKYKVMAQKTAKRIGARRFMIHPAFHAYLELEPAKGTQSTFAFGEFPGNFSVGSSTD
ncbi:MAG TPA: hypothetical protein VGU25_16605 [Acidobacteriaceae bacterium]|nr:hypothetical protein [Acidobacteriaceae bacterium]